MRIYSYNFIVFIFAKQTVVHKNTIQVFTDGAMQKSCSHGRVDTAGEREYHFVIAQTLLQIIHRFVDEDARCPVLSAATNINDEVFDQLETVSRMRYFRVELDCVSWLARDGKGRTLHIGCAGNDFEFSRKQIGRAHV